MHQGQELGQVLVLGQEQALPSCLRMHQGQVLVLVLVQEQEQGQALQSCHRKHQGQGQGQAQQRWAEWALTQQAE